MKLTKIRFLGNSCIEIIGEKDHIILDPAFLSPPTKGIEKIFITHHHSDHINLAKLSEIKEKFADNIDLDIYGPKSVKDELKIDLKVLKSKDKVKLKNGKVRIYENNCWKAENCLAYLLVVDNKYILHSADSSKFSNALRNMRKRVDYCFVACFEDNYSDYLKFLKDIGAGIAIPYHFDEEKTEMAKGLVKYLKDNNIIARYIEIGKEFKI
ncbi:MAG: hypothetical protein GF329_10345 [Candidatus Lokiarchaeota archaeon]|nr:hypothetical protein [Candidatus Lokiarchaeota archaeon]